MTFDVDAKMPIAMAKGNMMNIRLKVAEMSFREFGEFCSKPQKGGKHEAYFIRGIPQDEKVYISGSGREYYDGKFRHDDSLISADFLIIDADNAKSSPKSTASVFIDMNLVFFLYTTHSHSAEKNNFRVVIPCKVDKKVEMEPTALRIMLDLTNAGLDIKYVREMGVWSQCWYLPTRDNPDDGIFEHYSNMTGEAYVQSKDISATNNGNTDVKRKNALDSKDSSVLLGNSTVSDDNSNGVRDRGTDNPIPIENLIETMRTYGEGCHHAQLKFSHMMTEDGVAKKTVISTMKGIMFERKDDSKRNLVRFSEIDRIVEDREGVEAEKPIVFKEIDKTDKKKVIDDVKWPPGMMSELCQSAYNYSLYPDRTISLVSSLGLAAGIAGRRFNIGGSGLNLYLTLLMDTGGGKSVIGKFIRRVLDDANIFIGGDIFIGSGNYTGPKALMDDLHKKRCMISVFTEAGFMFRSKSGDKDGLTRSLLDLYGCSGYGCFSSGSNYSSDKNHIPAIASPCFSLVNESTPEVFLQALKDGAKTGEINRMNIFRLENPCTEFNRNHRFHVDPHILNKIKQLMARSAKTQTSDDPDITEFMMTDDMYDFASTIKREALMYRDDDYVRYSMMQRSAEKTFKLSALCTVLNLNPKEHKGERKLNVGKDEWEWALDMHKHEMRGLEGFFSVDTNEEMFSLVTDVLYNVISKLLNCKYKDRKLQPRPIDRKRNRFPLIMLRYALKNCRRVTDLRNTHRNKDGVDIVVEYLVNEGYINIKKVKPDNKKYIVVSPSFLELAG